MPKDETEQDEYVDDSTDDAREEVQDYKNMLSPELEQVVEKAGSKFLLVTLTAQRANDINVYYQGLGSGMAGVAPPQVGGDYSSYLSVAFEELHQDKMRLSRVAPEPPPMPEPEETDEIDGAREASEEAEATNQSA